MKDKDTFFSLFKNQAETYRAESGLIQIKESTAGARNAELFESTCNLYVTFLCSIMPTAP